MASGLEKQLARCNGTDMPAFCNDTSVYGNVLSAYNNLWNSIEANQDLLRSEVWSWVYNNGFIYKPLGDIPAPGGIPQTESDIVQVRFEKMKLLRCVVVELDIGFWSFEKPGVEWLRRRLLLESLISGKVVYWRLRE